MKKYLNCVLSFSLCILAISPVSAGNLKGEIGVALPSADTYIDHARDLYLVVVFPDGAEGNVVISDNAIDYEITEIIYPKRKDACPYRGEFIERS